MQIGTFSVVVGTAACDAACPFCVSKMTFQNAPASPKIKWRNFEIGSRFARDGGVSTMLLTGKGEPLLFPDQIRSYLAIGHSYFPFMELQTNGIRLFDTIPETQIGHWYEHGLTLVCLSIAHWDERVNADLMGHPRLHPLQIWNVVDKLHDKGLSVRLNCTMVKDGIDNHEDLETLLAKCRQYGVEQLTLRDVTAPNDTSNPKISKWVMDNQVKYTLPEWNSPGGYHHFPQEVGGQEMVHEFLRRQKATPIMSLPHGAMVWDCDGQNVCLNNCLTTTLATDEIRQLIFFPDGHLRYDWTYKGAVIL